MHERDDTARGTAFRTHSESNVDGGGGGGGGDGRRVMTAARGETLVAARRR